MRSTINTTQKQFGLNILTKIGTVYQGESRSYRRKKDLVHLPGRLIIKLQK